MTWQERAVCANDPAVSPEDFFPEGKFVKNSPEYRHHVSKMKALCNICPVRQECLQFADEHFEQEGIWGGMTGAQRKARRYPRQWINGRYTYVHHRAADGA